MRQNGHWAAEKLSRTHTRNEQKSVPTCYKSRSLLHKSVPRGWTPPPSPFLVFNADTLAGVMGKSTLNAAGPYQSDTGICIGV